MQWVNLVSSPYDLYILELVSFCSCSVHFFNQTVGIVEWQTEGRAENDMMAVSNTISVYIYMRPCFSINPSNDDESPNTMNAFLFGQ